MVARVADALTEASATRFAICTAGTAARQARIERRDEFALALIDRFDWMINAKGSTSRLCGAEPAA
jgi:hypothetical protein